MFGHRLAGAVVHRAVFVEPRTRSSSSANGGLGFLPKTSEVLANTTHVPCRWLSSSTFHPRHVDVEYPQRIVEVVLDTDDCGQMENRVDTGSQCFFECGQISDVALHEPEVGVPVKVNAGVAGVLCEVEDGDGVSAVPAVRRPSAIRSSRSRLSPQHLS